MNVNSNGNVYRVIGQVYEGEWFRVDPKLLYRSDFNCKKSDPWQEKTRQLILEAFAEMDKRDSMYRVPFYTMIPRRTWKEEANGCELKKIAEYYGERMASWVELALEWAQRISMGFSWGHLCNVHDTARWNRVITWKTDSTMAIVGGRKDGSFAPPATICQCGNYSKVTLVGTVPLVVSFGTRHPDAA